VRLKLSSFRIRYWLPGIPDDHEAFIRQLVSCKQAGFGGVELSFLGEGIGKPDLNSKAKWGHTNGSTREFLRFALTEGER
jgi:hypothetical protein